MRWYLTSSKFIIVERISRGQAHEKKGVWSNELRDNGRSNNSYLNIIDFPFDQEKIRKGSNGTKNLIIF